MSRRLEYLPAAILLAGAISIVAIAFQTSTDASAAWAAAVRDSWIDPATAARVAQLIDGAAVHASQAGGEVQPPYALVSIAPTAAAAEGNAVAANRSVDRLALWLGPLPRTPLTVVDVPARAGLAGAAYPGIAMTSTRWLTTAREFAGERAAAVAIARQYALALASGTSHDSWFVEGLADYLATRAVHENFEGRYFLTLRYFGGYLPHSLRAILMSPNPLDPRPRIVDLPEVFEPVDAPWRLAHGADRERAHRLALTLHTVERFIGWAALQASLSEFVGRYRGKTPALLDLTDVLSKNRGADMRWIFDEAMRADATFDYAVADFSSVPAAERWQTVVEVRRIGGAAFGPLPVTIRFADGSEVTESIDGRGSQWDFAYTSTSKAVLASVDPGAILLLDADRSNNTRAIDAPQSRLGWRLTLNWLGWLQEAMLACTASI